MKNSKKARGVGKKTKGNQDGKQSWLSKPNKPIVKKAFSKFKSTLPFSTLKPAQKATWLLLTFISLLTSLHFASSNLPSLYYAKLQTPKNPTILQLFKDFGPSAQPLFFTASILSALTFFYVFRYSYLSLRGKISIFESLKSHFIIILALTSYYLIFKETSLSYILTIFALFLLSLIPSKFKKNYLVALPPYPLSGASKKLLSLFILSISFISCSEIYAYTNFNKVINSISIKEDLVIKKTLTSALSSNSYTYNYHLVDQSSGKDINPIQGAFNSANCEEKGKRLDTIPKSNSSKQVESLWIRKNDIYYSNYAKLGFIRDDSRVNHIGPTMFSLIVTGAGSKPNAWGVCEDLHNIAKNVTFISEKTLSDGSQVIDFRYDNLKVEKIIKLRTWNWVKYLGFKGISAIYAYQENYPHYDAFLKSFDFLELRVSAENKLLSLRALIGSPTTNQILEELSFLPTSKVAIEKPSSFKDLSRNFKG